MTLTAAQRTAASKIAGLTIANAMVFQEVLSSADARVEPLSRTIAADDPVTRLIEQWEFIVREINYIPIFQVARELLLALPGTADIHAAIRFLAQRALGIVSRRAALRHDLMGRVYHQLLVEAKFLGTYYTSVPAATLLLKLALTPDEWDVEWSDLKDIEAFRVSDIACGTGTLLMAAAEAISDNYVRACAAVGEEPDLAELHRVLMERTIYGYDVLASALHLTASTLALRASAIAFRRLNLFSLPLGGPLLRLGSIEFLRGTKLADGSISVPMVEDLFGVAAGSRQMSGIEDIPENVAPLPKLDLCVMNPPFTRSVGGNRLFGSLPESERQAMQRDLSALLRGQRVPASSTAGLGAVFVAVGDRALKDGGRIALVLPKTLLSGVAWEDTRGLINGHYKLETVVVSHDPRRWNFSDNTELSEVLAIARKLAPQDPRGQGDVTCVNLWRNPTTVFEALSIAHSIMKERPPDVERGQGATEIQIGDQKAGEAIGVPWAYLRAQPLWMLPSAFAQSDLVRAAYYLMRGSLRLPGRRRGIPIPMTTLGDLGALGPDRRDIWDGFQPAVGQTSYPAYWGHDARRCKTLRQEPNKYLSPLPRARAGRPLRRVEDLWPKAGRILLAERLWLNTQRMVAFRVDTPVLSNVWWPLATSLTEEQEKALTLWLNSTIGLLILLANREETRGAWVGFKKPVLRAMPVLDVRSLDKDKTSQLAAGYDLIANEEIKPLPGMATDAVRKQLDDQVAATLGLPDVNSLRDVLGREPVISLEPLV